VSSRVFKQVKVDILVYSNDFAAVITLIFFIRFHISIGDTVMIRKSLLSLPHWLQLIL